MATQTNNYGLTKPAWDELVDVSVLNDNSDTIDAQMHANELSATQAVANMADAYDATATYAEGDYCTYGGKLYQANTDISTAEAFDATHWDETTAAEHFSDGGGGGAWAEVGHATGATGINIGSVFSGASEFAIIIKADNDPDNCLSITIPKIAITDGATRISVGGDPNIALVTLSNSAITTTYVKWGTDVTSTSVTTVYYK